MAPKLVVTTRGRTPAKPPRKLGRPGSQLWASVTREYTIEDAGGIELLTQACQALDMAEVLRARIERDGPLIETKAGPREHPSLKSELGNRAFSVRTLEKLGVTSQPAKPAGGQTIGGTEVWKMPGGPTFDDGDDAA